MNTEHHTIGKLDLITMTEVDPVLQREPVDQRRIGLALLYQDERTPGRRDLGM